MFETGTTTESSPQIGNEGDSGSENKGPENKNTPCWTWSQSFFH